MNPLQASKPDVEIEEMSLDRSSACEQLLNIMGLVHENLFYEVANPKDIIHSWINDFWCMALRMFKYVC